MTKTREPETKAMQEGRAELQAIVAELRAIKVRAVALSRRLKAAARTATPVAVYQVSEPRVGETAEGWLADSIKNIAREEFAETIKVLAWEARTDRRREIEKWVKDADEGARRKADRAHDPFPGAIGSF